MSKVIRDEDGVKLKYPERSCKSCAKYPCFEGIEKCRCDMAKYGCILYNDRTCKTSSKRN